MSIQERIRARSQVQPSGCWDWLLALDGEGYGRFSFEARQFRAHRASYMAFVGPIPDGMTIDHTCFNPACVNPDHLRPLPHDENARNKDPEKTPPWVIAARTPRYHKPKRQPLPVDAPVIDFEGGSAA